MIRLWCDVLDSAGAIIGAGPVALKSATVIRALDGSGKISLSANWSDDRTRELLQNERRVNIYLQRDNAEPRLFGRGIIQTRNKSDNAGSRTLELSGQDSLTELTFTSVLLNRNYSAVPIATVVEELAALAGWSATVDDSDIVLNTRFDGVNILQAIKAIARENGLHMRVSTADRTVEVGAFGADSGITLVNTDNPNMDMTGRGLIESMRLKEESGDIVNWILPIGAGEGEAALTLKNSTRDFVDSTTGADGRPVYYIKDDDSIALYGTRQKALLYKEITLLQNTEDGKTAGANALADAAYADLQRMKAPQRTYGLSVRGMQTTLQPGDKVRIDYAGPIQRDSGETLAEDEVTGDFWVMQVEESVSDSGARVSLEISDVDRARETPQAIMAREIERARVQNLKPATYPTAFVYSMTDSFSAFLGGVYPLKIDSKIVDIISVTMRITTDKVGFNAEVYYLNTIPDVVGVFKKNDAGRYPLVSAVSYTGTNSYVIPSIPAFGSRTASVTEEFDITDIILEANGGIYQTHTFRILGEQESLSGDDRYFVLTPNTAPPADDPYLHDGIGRADVIFTVLAVVQANVPI